MPYQNTFFAFVAESSDTVADGNGQSSVAYHITSDAGSVLMALDSDQTYYVTDLHLTLETVADWVEYCLVTLDSNSSDATATKISPTYRLGVGATDSEHMSKIIGFNTPIDVDASSTVAYLSLNLLLSDSDAAVSAGYVGFIDRQ